MLGKFDVVAIGSATRDNFLKGDFPLAKWKEAPSGEALLLPFGEKLEVKELYQTIGGNAANASVTFARHGFKTACMAKIGNDLPGREFLAHLKRERVNTKYIAASNEKPTAYSVLLLVGGERTILGYHGASDTLTLHDFRLNKLRSRWWYLSLAGESDVLYPHLMKFAKEHHIHVAVNPSGHHIKHRRADLLHSLKDLSFLVLNTGEAADLVGISFHKEEEVFKKLDELVPGVVAVTDGSNGVTVSDGTHLYKAGIFKEKMIADRTGAGDAFGSGFVAALAWHKDIHPVRSRPAEGTATTALGRPTSNGVNPEAIKYAIRFASANATSVVESIGATEGILTRKRFETEARWREFPISMQKLRK